MNKIELQKKIDNFYYNTKLVKYYIKNKSEIDTYNLNIINENMLKDNNFINKDLIKYIIKENSSNKSNNILDIVLRYKQIYFPLLFHIDIKITNTIFTLYYITNKNNPDYKCKIGSIYSTILNKNKLRTKLCVFNIRDEYVEHLFMSIGPNINSLKSQYELNIQSKTYLQHLYNKNIKEFYVIYDIYQDLLKLSAFFKKKII